MYGSDRAWSGRPTSRHWRTYRNDQDFEYEDDDEAERPRIQAIRTYRTVCVRLCDGYFWPISYATTSDRFSRDAQVCAKSCAVPSKLYVHETGQMDENSEPKLVDLSGKPYSALKVANLFRTKYNPSCSCKPQPWEQASLDRHHRYAVAAGRAKPRPAAPAEVALEHPPLPHASPWIRSRIAFAQSRPVEMAGTVMHQTRTRIAAIDGVASNGRRVVVAALQPAAAAKGGSQPVVSYLSQTAAATPDTSEPSDTNGVRILTPPMGLGAAKTPSPVRIIQAPPPPRRGSVFSGSDSM
jgi:hypothetical protein